MRPGQAARSMAPHPTTLVIACGALAREMLAVAEQQGLRNLSVTCLPAGWHNRPQKIPAGVRAKIQAARGQYDRIFVAYGDCGTGGELDRVLAEEGVERIAGPHCYEFFAGAEAFRDLMEAELGSFFLTDYLARHFDKLMIEGLGLDRHPELREAYFGNYRKLVYLAQTDDADLTARAADAARKIGLEFERRFTGYGDLTGFMRRAAGA
ncbi:DUF1638 domain-containing protein [Hyphomicrobium sp.]|uniref:DUF1638 domain-containing protein n=1 Tax=Hyphomicrobium sp. TaxID=82 RepID=UPI003D0AEE9E